MAIKKHRLAHEVVGMSQHHASLVHALKHHAIDKAFNDVKKAVQNADLVVLSTPVNTIMSLLPSISRFLKRGCIVTDVGSTKVSIVETAEKLFNSAYFVGSHPMAGSDKKGSVYAIPDLFNHSLCIMTPTERTNKAAEEKVKIFWTRLGANVKVLSPMEHDKILAYISHLPHLIAYALIGMIPQEYLEYSAQGLKDTTRIAASSPQMWNDICMANSKNIIKSLDEMVKSLSVLRKQIVTRDEQNLVENFKKAKTKRDGLNPTPPAEKSNDET